MKINKIAESVYDKLDDTEQFELTPSNEWNGGRESGIWEFDPVHIPMPDGTSLNVTANVAYDATTIGKYRRATHYEPEEFADLEISNPRTMWFTVFDPLTGDTLASWTAQRYSEQVGRSDDSTPLSDRQIELIKHSLEAKWEDLEDKVLEFEMEIPNEDEEDRY